MRFLLLLFFLLHIVNPSLIAQQKCDYLWVGSVENASGEALVGVSIYIPEKNWIKTTDSKGRFEISGLCDEDIRIQFSYLGYSNQEIKLNPARNKEKSKVILQINTELLSEVLVIENAKQPEHAYNYTSLSRRDLEAGKGKSLGESLKNISGVNAIQTGPSIFKPVIHGVHSQRILLLNNGVRQEGQQWGAEHAPEIDPFTASTITVIKDASAIKYGTDALGGVILIEQAPLPEDEHIGGEVNLIGQHNGRGGSASGMLQGASKKVEGLAWRTQASSKKLGDFSTPNYLLTNTGVDEFNYSATMGYHKNTFGTEVYYSQFRTRLGILRGSSISSTEDLINAMERDIPANTGDFSYTIAPPRQEVGHQLLKLTAHQQINRGELRFKYGWQRNERKEFDIRRGSLLEIPSINLVLNSHTLDLEWEHVNRADIYGCVGISGNYQFNENIPGTQRIPFIPNFENTALGVYLIEKKDTDRWQLEAGARYDLRYYSVTGFDFRNQLYREQLQFNNLSATLGAVYKINHQQSLSSSLANAWRPPHVVELYSFGVHQSAAAIEYGMLLDENTNEINPFDKRSYKNEQALKWVNSYRHRSSQWTHEVSAYANLIFNYIYLRPAGVTQNIRGVYPYFRYTQTNALFVGFDFSTEWEASKHFSLQGKASLLYASDISTNDVLFGIPSNNMELGARVFHLNYGVIRDISFENRVRLVLRQFRAPRVISVRELEQAKADGINLFEDDARTFDFIDTPPTYLLWNSAVNFSILLNNTKLDVRLAADNLLNSHYREYTNRMRYFADELGRNVSLGVKYTF